MAMQGNLRDITVADLIQYNCQDTKTASLIIIHNQQKATLFFDAGNVQHATLGELEGEEAIYEVLSWQEGTFILELGRKPPTVTINRSWSALLLRGAQSLDEIQNQLNDSPNKEHLKMAGIQDTLDRIMALDGAIATALVDWQSGMTLGTTGGGKDINIDVAAAGNTNVVRAKLGVMRDLKLKGGIEDILITLTEQYHLIRPLGSNPNLFIYVALKRSQANLGLARFKLAELEKALEV